MLKNKKKVLKRVLIAALSITILLIALFIIYLLTVNNRLESFKLQYKEDIMLDCNMGTTKSQRAEDFYEICNVLETRVAVINDYETLHGITYSEIKDYYKNIIENSETEIEYYSAMMGFLYNIPSAHLGILIPDKDDFIQSYSHHITGNNEFLNVQDYWNNIILNEYADYCHNQTEVMCFEYTSFGKYINEENDMAELVSINGTSPDEYITVLSSAYCLKYDHINKKSFRTRLCFNNQKGEKCIIEYITSDGKLCEKELYHDTPTEIVYKLDASFDYFSDKNKSVSEEEDIYTENYMRFGSTVIMNDNERSVLIVQMDNFNNEKSDGQYIANIMKSFESKNIIFDLRNNGGGRPSEVYDILSSVVSEDIEITDDIYCTKESLDRNPDFMEFKWDNKKELYKKTEKTIIKGEATEKKNIYVIVSDSTGSAAETFVNIIKHNNLGVIIGTNNTAGEAHGSCYWGYLKNSGVAYSYTEFKYFNPDGTSNSAYGTAPDIYIRDNKNKKEIQQLIESGEDPYTYENRLKWDNVLIETLEIIKEKENTK